HRHEGAHRPGAAEGPVRLGYKNLDPICDGAKCIAIAFREFPRPTGVLETLNEEEIGGLSCHGIFPCRGTLGASADDPPMSASRQKQTRAPQQTSGRASSVVSFVYTPVECFFYKFHGINCRPKSAAKLFDRFFHRRRQVSPEVKYLTHRFFDGYD